MLRSDLDDYNHAYIADRWAINFKPDENNDMPEREVELKNNAPFM